VFRSCCGSGSSNSTTNHLPLVRVAHLLYSSSWQSLSFVARYMVLVTSPYLDAMLKRRSTELSMREADTHLHSTAQHTTAHELHARATFAGWFRMCSPCCHILFRHDHPTVYTNFGILHVSPVLQRSVERMYWTTLLVWYYGLDVLQLLTCSPGRASPSSCHPSRSCLASPTGCLRSSGWTRRGRNLQEGETHKQRGLSAQES
jgi:hypothetical protein